MEDELSFFAFLGFVAVIIVICFIFGKADTKKEMLNIVGLDLSESTYESLKEKEFARLCLKALTNASLKLDCTFKDELDFLHKLRPILFRAETDHITYQLDVKPFYVSHADSIICRRGSHLKRGDAESLVNGDINNSYIRKIYLKALWKKYQYPWPNNWQEKDSTIPIYD